MKVSLILLSFLVSTVALGEISVSQKGKKFILPGRGPATEVVEVKKGDSIVFKNDDSFQHNIYSLSPGNSFELKTQDPGKSSTVKVEGAKFKGGKMDVECAIHPEMKMTFKIVD